MENARTIQDLISEIERISEAEKCLTCQCFYDTLLELEEILKKEKGAAEMEERLVRLIERAGVSHGCLGCDPCLAAPMSNALAEMSGASPPHSCGSSLQSLSGLIHPSREGEPETKVQQTLATAPWPVEQGEYVLGNERSPVAISTLGSDELPEAIAKRVGRERFSLVGKTHTENIGIEKIVKNAISNSSIRFLVLCGKDTKGHMAGQSLLSLFREGVNRDKRINGSQGKRPILKNLTLSEIQHFREQVHVIDLVGTEDLLRIEAQVRDCIEKDPGRFDRSLGVTRAPLVQAKSSGRLVLDPSGFFIVYPKKDERRIYLEHYRADGTLNEVICGEDPATVASTAVNRHLVSRLDHAAYLGRELEKAYLSMVYGFQYVQDSAP